MAAKGKPQEENTKELSISSAELLAALSYATDITPNGCYYHSWRVALVSEHLAASLCPDSRRDIFYAGLLHDLGVVGSARHITKYVSLVEQIFEAHVRSHPVRGAGLVSWLPGTQAAAQFIKCHHERFDGRGYPDQVTLEKFPLGGQILAIIDAADAVGCFESMSELRAGLQALAPSAGYAWSKELWAAFVRSVADAEFYASVTDTAALPGMIMGKFAELPLPEAYNTESGVERVFHLFAALVDLKIPATNGHSLRVARAAETMAKQMKLSDGEARTAYRAGLVHDIGQLGISAHILNKAGRLSEKEMEKVRNHAEMTIRVLNCLPDCADMIALGDIAGRDHERWDGSGYPDGLAAERIPMISRILSVVDAYDSMMASSNYRLLTPKGAVLRIEQGSGKQFDPQVAKALVDAVRSGLVGDPSQLAA